MATSGKAGDGVQQAPEANGDVKPMQEEDIALAAEAFLAESTRKHHHIFLSSPPGIGKTTLVQKVLRRLWDQEDAKHLSITGFYTEEVRDTSGQRTGFDLVRVGSELSGPLRAPLARVGQGHPRVGKYTVNVPEFERFALPTLETPVELPENPRLCTMPDGSVEPVTLLSEAPDQPAEADEAQVVILLPATGIEMPVPVSSLSLVPEGWRLPPTARPSRPPQAAKRKQPSRLLVCDEVGKMEMLSTRFAPTFLAALDSGAITLGTVLQPAKGQRDHELIDQIKRRSDVRVLRLTRNNRDSLVDQVYTALCGSLGLTPRAAGTAASSTARATSTAAATPALNQSGSKAQVTNHGPTHTAAAERSAAPQQQAVQPEVVAEAAGVAIDAPASSMLAADKAQKDKKDKKAKKEKKKDKKDKKAKLKLAMEIDEEDDVEALAETRAVDDPYEVVEAVEPADDVEDAILEVASSVPASKRQRVGAAFLGGPALRPAPVMAKPAVRPVRGAVVLLEEVL